MEWATAPLAEAANSGLTPALLAWLLLIGLLAGLLLALIGIGGGLVIVPFLHLVLDLPWHTATAVSLVVIVVQAPMGIWRHARKGALDWRLGSRLAVGGALGVIVASVLEARIPVAAFKVLFALVMAFAAWRLWSQKPVPRRELPGIAIGTAGFLAGLLAKWLGIGGGLITTPLMVLAGITPHVAVATSLLPVWTNALLGTAWNTTALEPALLLRLGGPMALAALVGAFVGVRIAHALAAATLKRVISGAMVVGLLAMLARAV